MRHIRTLLAVLALACAQLAAAQPKWPSQPIKLIVPYSAGGSSDQLARLLGQQLAKDLGQPVVVDNRPGASGMIGAAACKAAPADGHHFCLFLMEVVTTNPAIFKNITYRPETDFVPVAFLTEANILVPTQASSPINSLRDLAQASKAQPNAINWGSWGVGSTAHLVLAMINSTFGTSITHVPYTNTPALIQATISGEVNATIAGTSLVDQHIGNKTLKPIAVLGAQRLAQYPQVPTAKEQGLPFDAASWFGLFAPAAVARPQVAAMHDAVNRALTTPAIARSLESMGMVHRSLSQADYLALIKRDSEAWQGIARRSGISLD